MWAEEDEGGGEGAEEAEMAEGLTWLMWLLYINCHIWLEHHKNRLNGVMGLLSKNSDWMDTP